MAYSPPGQMRERVYCYVRDRLARGDAPTIREVQAAMGFSAVESARQHLIALVAEGRLVAHAGRARGYRLPKAVMPPATRVPVLGRVRAGQLHEAIEDPDGWIWAEGDPDPNLFALRVEGDSMTGLGILHGDVAIVRRRAEARDGDVVVAMVEGEATIKTLRLGGGSVALHAANPAYPPIVPRGEGFAVLGVVVEVRRRLA